jgi:hypothetical protein
MNRKRITHLAGTSVLLLASLPAAAGATPVGDPPTTTSGGFGWIDLVGGVAVLAGIALFGLFGDRVVGAIVVAVVEVPAAGARIAARAARRVAGRRPRAQTPIVTASARSSSPS